MSELQDIAANVDAVASEIGTVIQQLNAQAVRNRQTAAQANAVLAGSADPRPKQVTQQLDTAAQRCEQAAQALQLAQQAAKQFVGRIVGGGGGGAGSGAAGTNGANRTSAEPLFRADGRSPEEVFEAGGCFPHSPRSGDLQGFVMTGHGNFVSTTRDLDVATHWGKDWVYVVTAPGGIDVNRALPSNPHSREKEVAFPGGFRKSEILGAYPVNPDHSLGPFVPNPYYKRPSL